MGEGRGVHRVLVGKPEGKNHWGGPDADGRIILRWIFRKWEGVVRIRWSWLRWRALMSTVMNLGVPKMRGIS